MQSVRCASLLERISFSLGSKNLRRKLLEMLKERELSLWGALEARGHFCFRSPQNIPILQPISSLSLPSRGQFIAKIGV